MPLLKRYWFEFDESETVVYREGYLPAPGRFGYLPSPGCGITAYGYEDALRLLRRWVLRGDEFARFSRVVENADVSELFPWGEKIPQQIGCSAWRGVWYPALNLYYGPDLK